MTFCSGLREMKLRAGWSGSHEWKRLSGSGQTEGPKPWTVCGDRDNLCQGLVTLSRHAYGHTKWS